MRERTVIAGRYEVRAGLGRGGMAEVWEGYDQLLDRQVAVKLIRRSGLPFGADRDRAVARFRRECRVTAKLEHPGVPTVYDMGTHEDEPYLVMQLVAGHNLADVIAERGPFPVTWAAATGAQLCSVLAAAHAAGLVHRDLKPKNTMLCPDGSVKVLDFGIAAVLAGAELLTLTTTGQPVGSVSYMAPEQISGGKVGPAADLYALGCVLHELISGAPPFSAELPVAVMHHHLHRAPADLRTLRPDVPPVLADLVSQLLAKSAEQRPADAAEVYHRLVPYVIGPAAVDTGSNDLGPTRPYHFPLGPLPVLRGTAATGAVRLAPVAAPAPGGQSSPGRSDAAQALVAQRARAVGLVDQGAVTQAGQVLADATRSAAATLGADDPDVVDSRLALAHLYLLAADHGRGLSELQRLVPDLSRHYGPDHEFVWGAKRGIVECHAALGDRSRAQSALAAIVGELARRRDPADPELAELRAELYRLGMAAG